MSSNPVLSSAYAVLRHSQHVQLCPSSISAFAASLANSPLPASSSWADELLHPIPAEHQVRDIVEWIFMVSGLLNFSFWSELDSEKRFAVSWKDGTDGKGNGMQVNHTGYWSLPAAINRAREAGIPVTSPKFWTEASDNDWRDIFRPSQSSQEGIPLFKERVALLRQTGRILVEQYQGSFYNFLLQFSPRFDALEIVKAVVRVFPAFRDEAIHPQVGKVYIWKRVQILVAELWAAFSSCPERCPQISNIGAITMFADYRVPQILHDLGLISYSSQLHDVLSSKEVLESGSELEIQIRCGSIAAVEELRKELVKLLQSRQEDSKQEVNAVILDFWLWNRAKELEKQGKAKVECHRTRSIWY